MARIWFSLLLLVTGCPPVDSPPQQNMQAALRQRQNAKPEAKSVKSKDGGSTIATVNGRVISRGQIVDLLLRSHGAGLLEQIIALEAAEELGARKGLSITEADVDREYDRALRRVSEPRGSRPAELLDREAAESLLESVLADRNISREEFLLTLRRNAWLRKIVELENPVSDDELRVEYARRYGERVQVRHIQLSRLGDAERVHERLAGGEDFAELARQYSANAASADNGGLLAPFSAHDEELPAVLRQAAFALRVNEVSAIIRAGDWYHIVKLESRIPAEQKPFEEVIGELMAGVRERTAEGRMRSLYDRLLHEAAVEIFDPTLSKAYERRKGQALGEGE